MSKEQRQELKNHLCKHIPGIKIRETDEHMKFNVKELSKESTWVLAGATHLLRDLKIKRSGTGLVVIITF